MVEAPDTGTIALLRDLLRQTSRLITVEGQLFRAEMREAAGKMGSGFACVAVGLVLALVGLGCVTAALVLFLVRFMPPDAASGLVGLVALVVCVLLLMVAKSRLKPSGLLPVRTISQVSSTLEGLGR